MRTWWFLLIGLTGVFWITIPWGLQERWKVLLFAWPRSPKEWTELTHLVWSCAAVAVIPAFLVCVGLALAFRKLKRPSGRAIAVVAAASLAIGFLGGFRPLWKLDHRHELIRRDRELQGELEAKLDDLKRQGKYKEMVREMERVLEVHDALVAEVGPKYESCNIGFSHLYVDLSPASEDIPAQLGSGVCFYLYCAWEYGDQPLADELSKELTHSTHPLLRAIGDWVEEDYAAFEREALAGAEAGDRRMDTMALVAACAVSKDKKAALEKVRPILDRGVGLGKVGYVNTSSDIRDFLEGHGPRPKGYFMMEGGVRK